MVFMKLNYVFPLFSGQWKKNKKKGQNLLRDEELFSVSLKLIFPASPKNPPPLSLTLKTLTGTCEIHNVLILTIQFALSFLPEAHSVQQFASRIEKTFPPPHLNVYYSTVYDGQLASHTVWLYFVLLWLHVLAMLSGLTMRSGNVLWAVESHMAGSMRGHILHMLVMCHVRCSVGPQTAIPILCSVVFSHCCHNTCTHTRTHLQNV